MKILMTSIEVLAWFENDTPHPIRFKLADKELKIEQVVSMTEEKLAGNRMLCFHAKRRKIIVHVEYCRNRDNEINRSCIYISEGIGVACHGILSTATYNRELRKLH